jgi:glutamine amidotransferase
MKVSVTVVDYGMGNLYSVSRAFEHAGASVKLTEDAGEIMSASHLVLPGVGAFRRGMEELTKRDVVEPLRQYAKTGRPMLGICLGMQMLFDESDEFGCHPGLGLIPGKVCSIPSRRADRTPRKIPHIGWNGLLPAAGSCWAGTLLDGMAEGAEAYFVHSYTAFPALESDLLAEAEYEGFRITAVVRRGQLYGCQFHPEKSGAAGLRILDRFLLESRAL